MRIMKLPITGQVFVDMLKAGAHVIEIVRDGLPQDARFVNMYYDPGLNTWWLIVESQTFDDVPEGVPMLQLPPITIRTIRPS